MNNDYLNNSQSDNPETTAATGETPSTEPVTEPVVDTTAEETTVETATEVAEKIAEETTEDTVVETAPATEVADNYEAVAETEPQTVYETETVETATENLQNEKTATENTEAETAAQEATVTEAPANTPPVYQTPPASQPYQQGYQTPPYYQTTPQGTQGNQYGQPPYYYYPAPEPPKKKKKGHVAFLVCLFTLIGIFTVGFFVLCGYVAGQYSGSTGFTKPTFFNDHMEETEPVTDSTETEIPEGVVPLPEKDKEEYSSKDSIDLKDLPRDQDDYNKYTTKYAYKKVAESTIGVVCYKEGFTGDPASQGTGIVITKDGYIATNSHVIGDSRTAYNVKVVTNDGTTYEAKVVGFDARTDLAVLKVNANNLTPAQFCDSDLVEVGMDVIAVGNPGGMDFQNSLTKGVVSALNRELGLSAQVTYIQTDAAINPGNSGGPLSNMYGQVIGITTAKISSEDVEGMGFAIPSRTVKEIIDDLMSQGYVSNRVRLGISGQAVSSQMKQFYNLPSGILVGTIAENGPCHNTELKVNDVITKMDSTEVDDFSDVYAFLSEHKPGDKVVLTVYRSDTGKTFEMTITLAADEGETQQ